jgi:hypothetical protein
MDVRLSTRIRGALGRAFDWSAVMLGLVWLLVNARRSLRA